MKEHYNLGDLILVKLEGAPDRHAIVRSFPENGSILIEFVGGIDDGLQEYWPVSAFA